MNISMDLASDLRGRELRFRKNLDIYEPHWKVAVFLNKINIYYFTGTLQNGVFIIPRDGESLFFVKKSFDRAVLESPLKNIYPISSFRDILNRYKPKDKTVYIEKNTVPIGLFESFNKYYHFEHVRSLDFVIFLTRAVKSEYELVLQKKSGEILNRALTELPPKILKEGISELEAGATIIREMLSMGHEGVTRLGSWGGELFVGCISFGEYGNYYTAYDGPVGHKGISVASPFIGSPSKLLTKNNLVIIDYVCNVGGYHTDKTIVYFFGKADNKLKDMQKKCIELEYEIVNKLRPGIKPSEIYEETYKRIDEAFKENFMGYASNQVKFLGHGIGLIVDEYPVIAKGFDCPIEANMTIAIEPKKAIEGVGMVGSENTYLVTENGGISLTGQRQHLIEI